MSLRPARLILLALGVLGPLSCSEFAIEKPADEPGRPAIPGLLVLHIRPPEADLWVGEEPATVRFTAVGEFVDGRSEDVTARVQWSFSAPRLGYLKDGATLVTTGYGGEGQVEARTGTLVRAAPVRLRARRRVVLPGADGAAEERFAGPAAAEAPRLVYPYDEALLPPNLGRVDVHFRRPATQGLFEVALRSAWSDLRLYGRCQPMGDGCAVSIERELWAVLARSNPGADAPPTLLTVRGLDEQRGVVGEAQPVRLRFAAEDVRGGLYYWTSVRGADGSGVYRIDMERGRVEPFYTQESAPPNHRGERGCVGCHALSRSGDRMALVLGGGHISDLVQLDVSTRRPTLQRIDQAPGKSGLERQFSNFQSYGPDGTRFVAALLGRLRLVSALDGADLFAELPTGGPATHPDWSRSGALLAYTRFFDPPPRALAQDGDSFELHVRQGAVGLLRWDGAAFRDARILVPAQPGRSSFYPSLSPDDRYVAFNRAECPQVPAECAAYDNARARVVLAAVADGAEIALGRLNQRGPTDRSDALTNSWPKFGPFLQRTDGGKTLLWVTFSSKRDYGLRLMDRARPQLWMAALVLPPDPGADASFAPFWVPYQDPETHNHIAQWTEQVVPIVQ